MTDINNTSTIGQQDNYFIKKNNYYSYNLSLYNILFSIFSYPFVAIAGAIVAGNQKSGLMFFAVIALFAGMWYLGGFLINKNKVELGLVIGHIIPISLVFIISFKVNPIVFPIAFISMLWVIYLIRQFNKSNTIV